MSEARASRGRVVALALAIVVLVVAARVTGLSRQLDATALQATMRDAGPLGVVVFLAAFTPKYGMELLELHLAEIDTAPWQWQDVSEYGDGSGGRNTFNFMSTKLVYIIAVARKITNERASLIGSPPQQHGYAAVSWPRRLA